VRNVPGDGQMLGASEVWRADADGCTLITYNPPSITIAQLARGEAAPVDIREAAYVGIWGFASLTLYGSVDSPGDSLEEVIELYQNGTLSLFGAQDRSGPTDLLARVIKSEYGVDWDDIVAYDGGGDLNAAIIRGEVPYGITTDTSIQGLVENGQAKVIAVLTDLPSSILPDAPTALDQGFSSVDFIANFTRMVAATPGSPPEQIAYLEAALKAAIESDEIQSWAADTGNPVGFRDAEAARSVVLESFRIEQAVPNLAELLN
jgi:tripartite-type tricarboxylate transporter receptor subunit TctC